VFSALLVLSDASSFFCFLARFMLLGSFFTWVYLLFEPFFFPVGGNPITDPRLQKLLAAVGGNSITDTRFQKLLATLKEHQ
jgi:hypothetical protein